MNNRTSFGPDVAPRLSYEDDMNKTHREKRDSIKSKRSQKTQSYKKTSDKNTSDKNRNMDETKSLSNSMANTNERHSALPFLNIDSVTQADPDITSPNFNKQSQTSRSSKRKSRKSNKSKSKKSSQVYKDD